jgi:pyruvate/2-oxoglutarate dehydrogenase complex dihydrolipoamide dehydrogenase (E3) component
LIVLGGGYVGLEFAQMFRRFGSEVTIVQRGSQLLTREDKDVAEGVADILLDDGVNVLLNANARSVSKDNGEVRLRVEQADREDVIPGSHLLVATGRAPNVESLNLEAAGIETSKRGHILVNERLETNAPGIYALGDVKGGPAFTHISYDDYRVLKANLIDGKDVAVTGRLIPYTVFIDPQLGRVGLSEAQAAEAGYGYEIAKMPMSRVARAIETGETRGFIKVVVELKSRKILGCAVLGVEGGEIMNMLQIAMMGKLPYTALRDTAMAHPTLGESLNNLFLSLSE